MKKAPDAMRTLTIAVAQGAGRGIEARAWVLLLEKLLPEQVDRRIFFQEGHAVLRMKD
ncbi:MULTISPECIES: hypothetical protein [unclassified Mesorhizobium]|uniref:hypothetical protein n=1 Tax=unclassified Mesorhizobium TaxID=325217 RepID=UPI0015CA5150|nr:MULTISPECIES: hypothetical protein [unclassified Mesorhizobium]